MSGGWALSLALIGLGFLILGVWSHVERQNRERRPRDISRLIAEIRRHEENQSN